MADRIVPTLEILIFVPNSGSESFMNIRCVQLS